MIGISPTAVVTVSIAEIADVAGNPSVFPDGTTFAFEAIQLGGTGVFGAVTQTEGPNATFTRGDTGCTGIIRVTATLPDGSMIAEDSDILENTPGVPASFKVVVTAVEPSV